MIAKLPANVELDDLIQVGMIGLHDALGRFDVEHGVKFETFATQRIRGAMLDELRRTDWMGRVDRRQQRGVDSSVRILKHRLGRAPQESEVAAEMGLPLTDYQELLGNVLGTQLVYLEDMSGGHDVGDDYLDRHVGSEVDNPPAMLQEIQMRQALVDAIKRLPEREQYVMSMYYEYDMNLKEIAAVLKVTESRVCQLHRKSITQLRRRLSMDDDLPKRQTIDTRPPVCRSFEVEAVKASLREEILSDWLDEYSDLTTLPRRQQ